MQYYTLIDKLQGVTVEIAAFKFSTYTIALLYIATLIAIKDNVLEV